MVGHRQDQPPALFLGIADHFGILFGDAFRGVDQDNGDIAPAQCRQRLEYAEFFQFLAGLALAPDTGRVDQQVCLAIYMAEEG